MSGQQGIKKGDPDQSGHKDNEKISWLPVTRYRFSSWQFATKMLWSQFGRLILTNDKTEGGNFGGA
jgi:hypothetical protein